MSRLIKLETWAKDQYGDDAPSLITLRRWARNGNLFPAAEQHGKCWYVTPGTKYMAQNNGSSIIDRMKAVYGTSPA